MTSGVRQGCVLAPALICVAIDWILRHMKDKTGIEVGREHFSDLVYADDTAFLVNTTSDAVSSLSSFQDTASALGLRISWPKTKAAKSRCRPPTTICFSRRQYSRQCGQFRLLGKSALLGWPLPARYQ